MNFDTSLEKAYSRRLSFIKDIKQTSAFRLFSGHREGIPGLVIDIYDTISIFQIHEGKCLLSITEIKLISDWCAKKLDLKSIYVKRFIPDRSYVKEDLSLKSPQPFWGERCNPEIIIRENKISYLIHPYDGYSVGIFLDQRRNRTFLSAQQKKRVLNCFSYTCAFSVACALQGSEVTSVDVSKKYLEWGKQNFITNQLDPMKHRFVLSDVIDYLVRIQKKGEVFDLIILDPPSFGRSNTGVFSIKKDLKKLIQNAALALAPEGTLFFSTNYSEWDASLVRHIVTKYAVEKYPFQEIKTPEIPKDFELEENPLSQVCLKRI